MSLKLIIYFIISLPLFGSTINISETTQEVLSSNLYYVDYSDLKFDDVVELNLTKKADNIINLGFDNKATAWVKLEFFNPYDKHVERVLEVENPMIPKVVLYDNGKEHISGMFYVKPDQDYLNAAFTLRFKPHEKRTIWLSVENEKTTLQFELFLKTPKKFYHDNLIRQMSITFFLGAIISILIFSLMVAIYAKSKSYFLYAFYLVSLIYQQLVYSGILQLHAPQWLIHFNDHLNIPMVAIVIVAASWYAMNFLETSQHKKIHKAYKFFIVFIVVQMPFLGFFYFYIPEAIVYTGLIFIFFNTYSGYYIYKQGYTQARFFLAGWMILILFYLLLIMDSLGIYTTPNLPTWMMFATSVEALFLLLAYVDLFSLADKEKRRLHKALIVEYNLRQKLIEDEVTHKTKELSLALDQKELLYKELHHRVKNNLQIILSILRLQQRYSKNKNEHSMLMQFESRINAIAKVHELLYHRKTDDSIDMSIYVKEFVKGMSTTFEELSISLYSEVDALLPVDTSIYVGLIINELVSNAVKYAYGSDGGAIYIKLQQTDTTYLLEVYDEGNGYDKLLDKSKSLGLKLIDTLVVLQLNGSIDIDSSAGVKYTIRFKI